MFLLIGALIFIHCSYSENYYL